MSVRRKSVGNIKRVGLKRVGGDLGTERKGAKAGNKGGERENEWNELKTRGGEGPKP